MRIGQAFRAIAVILCLLFLAGCGQAAKEADTDAAVEYLDVMPLELVMLEDETIALSEAPAALPDLLLPEASGALVKNGAKAKIDYSNTKDGYVMVQYTAATQKRLKVQVKGPTTTYTYNLSCGAWEVFPLSDGNGKYQIAVFENVSGSKYAVAESMQAQVTLENEFAPFLRPNQYVNYNAASQTVVRAEELMKETDNSLKKVELVYDFVVGHLTYDTQKAASVKSGYLPVLDEVLAAGKGICFDYAALMTGMLRSQNVPCKLVVGYAGNTYHAWINVWTEESGWINGAIFFDGKNWKRMDPTFASSGKQSASIMAYIGDGKNYTTKYLY